MPDSFSELRTKGGSNTPWVAAGVSALAVALILIALAAAYWAAQPKPEPTSAMPATVTVTAQQEPLLDDVSPNPPTGTYSGTMVSLEENPKVASWPAVATFGGDGTGQVTYPLTGCTALIGEDGASTALTKQCVGSGEGQWSVDKQAPGVVHLTYSEGGSALVEGSLSLGAP
mgnify:FL=1